MVSKNGGTRMGSGYASGVNVMNVWNRYEIEPVAIKITSESDGLCSICKELEVFG